MRHPQPFHSHPQQRRSSYALINRIKFSRGDQMMKYSTTKTILGPVINQSNTGTSHRVLEMSLSVTNLKTGALCLTKSAAFVPPPPPLLIKYFQHP